MLDTGENRLKIEAGRRIVRWELKLMKREEKFLERICWMRRRMKKRERNWRESGY